MSMSAENTPQIRNDYEPPNFAVVMREVLHFGLGEHEWDVNVKLKRN